MNKRLSWTWVVLVSVALAACGGDDDSGDDTPIAGASGAAGTAGAGGTAGTAGTAGMSGAGGTAGAAATTIPCGTGTCMSFMLPLPLPLPAACCADEATATCGTMMAGGMCMPPMPSDPRCPMVTSPLPGLVLASCCAENGMCGVDASALGLGCRDFGAVAASMFGAFLPVPAPVSCDGSDGGVDEDAGR